MKSSGESPRRRWFLVLVGLNLLTTVLWLLVAERMVAIYEDSVRQSAEWGERIERHAALTGALVELNAPGNDVFETLDVAGEVAAFDSCRAKLTSLIATTERDFRSLHDPESRARLLSDIQAAEDSADKLTTEARSVFAELKAGRRAAAGRRMAAMDRRFAQALTSLSTCSTHLHSRQQVVLKETVSAASRLEQLAYAGAAAVVLLLAVMSLYWRRVSRRIAWGEEQLARAKDAAEAAEARQRAVVENSVDGIITIDARGRIQEFNPASAALFGFEKEEVVGQSLTPLLGELHGDDHDAFVERYLQTGIAKIIGLGREVQAKRKDGTEFPIFLSVNPMVVDGETSFVGVLRDISEEKRTAQALLTAKQAAEAASRAKSEFLAVVSHEIRTPMNGVLGMTGLLLDTDLTPSQREHADIVRSSAEALLALINDILDFSKIEAGKIELELLDFDLHTVVDDIHRLLSYRASAKGLAFEASLAPELPRRVRGDPGRLRQILVNLAANAIKFTKEGTVRIQVELDQESEAEVCVRFSVSDTGIGIPEQARGKLFRPFSQADASTSRTFGGTGLGLAISRQLTELMGGEIGAESEEGAGSTFWFTVRLEQASSESAALVEPEGDRGLTPIAASILLAEDIPINQLLARALLERLGCRVTCVANGQEVLEALEAFDFDLIFMDCHMPELDGIEATRRIRQAEEPGARIPIVAMTASNLARDRASSQEAGMDDYLTKPLRADLLERAVRRWANPPSGGRARRRPPDQGAQEKNTALEPEGSSGAPSRLD